jgi:putative intracellular protease/amidase/YHS domain-containing protein
MFQPVRLLLLIVAFVLVAGSTPATEPLRPQTTCPDMGGPINKSLYVDYKGKRIYLCCEGCRADVQQEPEKYLKKLEATGQAAQPIPAAGQDLATTTPTAPAEHAKVRTLGIFLFPGFETLDVFGPIEMWGNLPGRVQVVTVALHGGEVVSAQGQKIIAEYGLENCPSLDLILVPGGGSGLMTAKRDQALLSWIRERAKKAEIVMSVCNGATLLEAAELLDGRPATTNKALFKTIAAEPEGKVRWVPEARWVDDGNIVTSSGVSAGIDMSLHVIGRLFGENSANELANRAEYERHPDSSWDPFAKLHGLIESK